MKRDPWAAFRFAVLSGLSFGVNFFLTIFLHENLRVREEWAFAIVLALTTVMNFSLLRFFVYPGPHGGLVLQFGAFVASSLGFRILEWVLFVVCHRGLGFAYQPVIAATLVATFVIKFFYYGSVIFTQHSRETLRTGDSERLGIGPVARDITQDPRAAKSPSL